MLLLRYLCTELIAKRRLDSAASLDSSQASHVSQLTTTNLDKELSACIVLACTSLGIPSPTPGFDISTTFDAINNATIKALKRCPSTYFGQPVLPLTGLSDRQWGQVARISGLLQQEYAVRHATMLKRLNVTVQSFKWSDKAKRNLEAIAAAYQPIYSELTKPVFPGIPELLAVRDNMILRIEKTSGLHARRFTTCTLNKILIGQVPDRGGRAWELEPPPPEMPAFKQRQPDQGRGGASFGGGRGGGGGGGGGGGFGSDRGRGGSVRGAQQQFRPPAPSAQCGGGDYVVSQPAYLALNQQMHGLTFERGMGIGHPQGYVFQVSPSACPGLFCSNFNSLLFVNYVD
ncbi:unnamed protein product [Dicrocoelium dendriticum]|nr:unnamed protein product [Dicrocoelium dendriticum]